jgi:hypothetical protein
MREQNTIWTNYYKSFTAQRNKEKPDNLWSVKGNFPDIKIEATDGVKTWEIMTVHFKCE